MSTNVRSKNATPKWVLLYALVPIGLIFFWVADLIPGTSSWRVITECGAVLAMCGLAIAWVRANRVALTQTDLSADVETAVDYREIPVRYRVRPRRIRPRFVAPRHSRLPVAR